MPTANSSAETFTHDVFLSHSSKDKVVGPLGERLQKDGLKVWFNEWELPASASRQSAAYWFGELAGKGKVAALPGRLNR